MKRWQRNLGFLLLGLLALALWSVIGELKSRRDERRSRAVADIASESYRELIPLGASISLVEAEIEKSGRSTLIRGDQYVLAITGKGVAPWFCDDKYLGTIFSFRNGHLTRLNSGEMLGRCL